MRKYDREGWVTQLQGRRVVGHYSYSALFYPTASAGRFVSLRNPLNPNPSKQRHIHVVSASCSVGLQISDDAPNDVQALVQKATAFTVGDTAGGSAIGDADFSRQEDLGFASVLVGRAIVSGGTLSGGTVTANAPLVLAQLVAPASTTNAAAYAHKDWQATYGPMLCKGDQGFLFSFGNGTTAPGQPALWCQCEWLETEPTGG